MGDPAPQHRYNLRNTPQRLLPPSSPATIGFELDSDELHISFPGDDDVHSQALSIDSNTSTVDYNRSPPNTQPSSPEIKTGPDNQPRAS